MLINGLLQQLRHNFTFKQLCKAGFSVARYFGIIARPKDGLPKAARPKGGLFRYHVKRIHFTMQGFGFVSAILDEAKLMALYYYYGSAAII